MNAEKFFDLNSIERDIIINHMWPVSILQMHRYGIIVCDEPAVSELKSDSVSVGGWVMEQLNKVPVKGESFTTKHLEITVSELDAHRVSSITVRQLDESPAGCASST